MNYKDKITEITITPIKPNDGLVGFVSFTYDQTFYLGSIGIYTRIEGGYRLTYPLRKNTMKNINYFYPINKDIQLALEEVVTEKYEELMSFGDIKYE